VSKPDDRNDLWKLYQYTSRCYCSDIATIRNVERRYIFQVESWESENGEINSKRKLENHELEQYEGQEPRKQIKPNE